MWPARRAVTALLMLGPGLVRSAINLDGSRAIMPLGDGDPSPIHDAQTYEPEQYDCPLQCADRYANMHRWTPYLSVDRLRGCQEPISAPNKSSIFKPRQIDRPASKPNRPSE
ncbi:hypothetical protein N656DRAFT_785403 [Canariomyces notabilis]|uniref:Uncharacterized protein n=1 Tax=Canariomyces notabilis TaxID=2074819 RepID=A0AAN6QH44_9PEZI|nr:hypothetical protein N656DRAFT_785403 [Canariomyces arenarius]